MRMRATVTSKDTIGNQGTSIPRTLLRMTRAHHWRWIMEKRWQLRRDGHDDVIIEVIKIQGARYGILWASGENLRVKGGLDRKDADAQAQTAMDKISETGWVDMSVT